MDLIESSVRSYDVSADRRYRVFETWPGAQEQIGSSDSGACNVKGGSRKQAAFTVALARGMGLEAECAQAGNPLLSRRARRR